ncbi:glycosyltransferase family 20 protein [Xylariaceae sp. FL0255]|nr:glycosyltransferase family 20 protein [Xylariaceae sp. FL0255]
MTPDTQIAVSVVSTESESEHDSPDLPPHRRRSITRIPVTPGFYHLSHESEFQDESTSGEDRDYFTGDLDSQDPFSYTNSVANPPEPASSTSFVGGAMSDKDVLRFLSTANGGRRQSITEIRSAAPDLKLSGNILSVTFTAPNTFKFDPSGEWELTSRQGQSALFDAFAYLSSEETPWNHSVVAWTGEIECPCEPVSPLSLKTRASSVSGLSYLSAPVSLANKAPPTPPHTDGMWISRESQVSLEQQLAQHKRTKTIPVWLADDDEINEDGIVLSDPERWRRYAEHELYLLFHYKQHEPTDGRSERVEWANYYRANLRFANKIIEVYQPGDIVIVHEYYLMLLPNMLRQRVPNMYIAFFLHCPFPSSEFLRCLPRRKEVLEGLLGSNLVGFQSHSYSRHFTSCATRILDFPSDANGLDVFGSRVEVGAFPIGIDATKVENFAWSKEVTKKYEALKEIYKGKHIIVGRDRLDSVRGVAQKLGAFERFLELYPEWRDKVVLIQVTSPARIREERGESKSRTASRVNEMVMKINGAFGNLGFSPVQYYPRYLALDDYFALLRAADIGLITSVRDGMNTASLEYVVCQRDTHGPLILSEFSGTAGSLRDAIHINPWDLSDVAHQINNALTMSIEKRQSMQASLYAHVTLHNAQSWITKFIRKLVTTMASNQNDKVTPLLDRTIMLERYRAARKRLFMFDYDGTLTPIVKTPQAAIPSRQVIQALKTLVADPKNAVWIISGRDQEFLQQHLGHITELGFSAEHGAFIRNPGTTTWDNLAERFDMGWQAEVVDIMEKYTDRVSGSFIERKRCALTWHYRQADPEQGAHQSSQVSAELKSTVATKWDVEVMTGKANVEVRPTFVNKGEIVKRLVHEYNSESATDMDDHNDSNGSGVEFVFCCGDDFTDEDMFRALDGLAESDLRANNIFTVSVGAAKKNTLAKWHILEPDGIISSADLLGRDGLGSDVTETLSQVNLAAVAGLEGHIPT